MENVMRIHLMSAMNPMFNEMKRVIIKITNKYTNLGILKG